MKLYHGTTEAVARQALSEGIQCRANSGVPTQWPDCPSRADMTYLTRAYAPYFAMCASGSEPWGLIEIDTEIYELEDDLYPDEDYLEQATRRGQSECPEGLNMVERTAWFRKNLLGYQHVWEDSLNGLGNCAVLGDVPADCVTRVVLFEPSSNLMIASMAIDPQVTLMNYQILGGTKYRALTDWFFGAEVEITEFDPSLALLTCGHPMGLPTGFQQYADNLEAAIAKRSGIEILTETSAVSSNRRVSSLHNSPVPYTGKERSMQSKTVTKTHFLLRFWNQKTGDTQYAHDMRRWSSKREWWPTSKRGEAYRFDNRSDARKTMKSVAFDRLLRPSGFYGEAKPTPNYYWEVVKVTETIVTTSEEEIIVSDAPAMVVIARASQ